MTARSFVILDTYYADFVQRVYRDHPKLTDLPYERQREALMGHRFGTFDAYSFYLRELGHQAEEMLVNVPQIQLAWAREHVGSVARLEYLASVLGRHTGWLHRILLRQIKRIRPDVLFTQDMNWLDAQDLRAIRSHVGVIIGQIGSELRHDADLSEYDLILSSFPHYVSRFRHSGLRSHYFQLGFDPRLLGEVESTERRYPITFVGGLGASHQPSMAAIEQLAATRPLDVWGYGLHELPPKSPLWKRYHGGAWGREMFSIMASSQVTLNRHIGVSQGYANNMRLYEATGMGACLVTDDRKNLSSIFDPDREVVPYSSAADLVEKVEGLVGDPAWREDVAIAGQRRTLAVHTYRHRMEELDHLVDGLFRSRTAV